MASKDNPERELQDILAYQRTLAKRGRNLPKEREQRLAELRSVLARKAAEIMDTKTTEKRELNEQQKIDAALTAGQRRGWVDIHDVGNSAAEKRCIIIGSAHYSHPSVDISKIPEFIKRGQFQLFGQLHLLQEHGVQSPLLVEGWTKGKAISSQIEIRFPGNRSVSVRSEEAQQHFLRHPEHFIQLQHDMHVQGKHPNFWELSSYPHIEGAHSPDVASTLDRVYALQLDEKRFIEKYRPKNGANDRIIAEMHNGRWCIFINQQWVEPEVLFQDCTDCLQFLDELQAFNIVREDEVIAHFTSANAAQMPLIWVGLGHVKPITEKCLALGMSMRKVVPTADRQTTMPTNSRGIATELKQFAEKYAVANQVL